MYFRIISMTWTPVSFLFPRKVFKKYMDGTREKKWKYKMQLQSANVYVYNNLSHHMHCLFVVTWKTISGYGSPNSPICIIWHNLYGFNSKVVDAKRMRVISFMICSLKITDDNTCRLYYICSIVVGAVCLKKLSIKISDNKNPELILYN